MRAAWGTLAAAVLLGAAAAPADASCAEDSGPEGADLVFVGTAEENRRGYTRLAVEEVWHGPDLAPQVWVLAGQEQPPFPLSLVSGMSSSVDADLVEGRRYVIGASRSFDTGACSVEELVSRQSEAEGRPDDPREPTAAGLDGADPPAGPVEIGLVTGALVLAVAAGLSVLLRHRRAVVAQPRS